MNRIVEAFATLFQLTTFFNFKSAVVMQIYFILQKKYLDDAMLQALAMNKVEFVKLFIECGVRIDTILTKDNLSFLYFYAYAHSDDSMLKQFNPRLLSKVERSLRRSIAFISDDEFLNKRMDLEELKKYVTKTVCTNTVRDDISFFEVS